MPSKYDQETKAKAIRLFRDHVGGYGSPWAAMCAISGRLGMTAEMLRKWVRQAEVDEGQAAGVPTGTAREIRELKRKNAGQLEGAQALAQRGLQDAHRVAPEAANSWAGPCRNADAPPSPAGGGTGSASSPAARMPLMVR